MRLTKSIYVAGIDADSVRLALDGLEDGRFVIQDTPVPNNYVLRYRFDGETMNKVVLMQSDGGWKLSNSPVRFSSLAKLINSYSERLSEDLPCKLIPEPLLEVSHAHPCPSPLTCSLAFRSLSIM